MESAKAGNISLRKLPERPELGWEKGEEIPYYVKRGKDHVREQLCISATEGILV